MNQPAESPRHLFVYGTLRSDADGNTHARLMRGVRHVGPASIRGRLYDAGSYPAAVADEDNAERIVGELYAIDIGAADRLLTSLDAYEGFDATNPDLSLFRRAAIVAERDDGPSVPAWAYLFNRSVRSMPRITSGDWLRREAPSATIGSTLPPTDR